MGTLSQHPNGFSEANSFCLHEIGKNIPPCSAAKAFEDLSFGINVEGGGLLPVKRAERFERAAGLPQGERLLHKLNDINGLPYPVEDLVGDEFAQWVP